MIQKPARDKKLGTLTLAAVIFFTISGGPYGLEPLIYYCGGKLALALLAIVPLLWDVPTILLVLELNSMMPETGGYYQWVKRALGIKWAFYEGWWSWLYTFVDLAIYPQLALLYAGLFFPGIAAFKVPVCLCLVWACAAINIVGIVPVGKTSVAMAAAVVAPFVVLLTLGIVHWPAHPASVITAPAATGSGLGMAIFTVIWNFIGWDNVTTYASEVRRPAVSYLRATTSAFALIFVLYVGTVLVAQHSGINPADLRDKGFPAVGALIGGRWLAAAIAAGGIVSSVGLFLAVLLSISRIPEAMAADKLLPKQLYRLHPYFATPYISIIICACIVSCMVLWPFGDLLIIDVTVYFAGLLLEFASLLVLRRREPDAHRSFRIPLNVGGLWVMLLLPVVVYIFAISGVVAGGTAWWPCLFSLAILASAIPAWWFFGRRLKNYVLPPGSGNSRHNGDQSQ